MDQETDQPKIIKVKSKTKTAVAIVAIAAIILAGVFIYDKTNLRSDGSVIIAGQKINVQIAKTNQDQITGLSGHWVLNSNQGMLFAFGSYTSPSFWMKDMNFPLDIIWIKDNMIAGLDKNLKPEGSKPTKTYQPNDFINYVLEVPAGFADKNSLKIGDKVQIIAKN